MTRPDLLRDILEEMVDALGLRERLRALRALINWKEVVGETVAAAAQPEALKEGKVFVAVKSNAWIQELRFQQQTILQRLNEYAGAPIFTELVFRVRPRSRGRQTEHAAPEEPPSADIEVDTATIARLHALTDPITEEELRAKITELLVGYHRLLHMRKQRGWQECARCGCLHPHEGSKCLFCSGELT